MLACFDWQRVNKLNTLPAFASCEKGNGLKAVSFSRLGIYGIVVVVRQGAALNPELNSDKLP